MAMKSETFVRLFKEIYPNGYESLESEFESYYRKKGKSDAKYERGKKK